jgi:hypothetical protein
MKKKDYIPKDKFQLGVWLVGFLEAVKADPNHYGINKEQIKVLEDFVALSLADLKNEKSLIDQKRTQVAKTGKDRKAVIDISREIAQIIKASPNYDNQVGEEFDIIGEDIGFDSKTFKPVIVLRRVSNGVEISFNKSQTDGVNIYRRVSGDSDFIFLAHDTYSPYIDTKQMDTHATYEYMAWAVIKDKEIGKASGPQIITV